MKIINQFFYALGISILFLLAHIDVAHFNLGDIANLILSLGMMVVAQLAAFMILKRKFKGRLLSFMSIFYFLSMTQAILVILLALNSAFNPLVDFKPINYREILVSLIIFAVLFPLAVTIIIWFTFVKRRNDRIKET